MNVKVTYYLEVLSSWCYWVEPTWAKLKANYESRGVEFDWKIALMPPGDFPGSAESYDWFLRRSGLLMRSPFMLNSAWADFPYTAETYPVASAVAEAARSLGYQGDGVRLALAHAGEREGKKTGRIAEAVAVAAKVSKLNAKKLRAKAESAGIKARLAETTAEFTAHQINQRPAFVLTDAIGDKAVFSGLVQYEPLAATIEAMLADVAGYAAHRAHFGDPPK